MSGVNIKIAAPIQKKASETETKNAQLWIERWFLLYQLFYPPSNCDTVCTIIVFKIKPRFAWLWLVREFTCEITFKRYCLYMFMYVTFFFYIPICLTEKKKWCIHSISTNTVIVDRLKYFCIESDLGTHVYNCHFQIRSNMSFCKITIKMSNANSLCISWE